MASSVIESGIEHRVESGGLKLFVWEKPAQPTDNGQTRAELLVHGSTYGGPTVYDVQVPGKDYSLMDYLAARGLDVFTFDVRGYGQSERPEDAAAVTTEAAVQDIGAVVEFICARKGAEKVDLLGWSWGGTTTSIYATRHPERVRRLVMYAGGAWGRATTAPVAQTSQEAWVTITRENIMARVEQDAVFEDAQEEFIATALRRDVRSPAAGRWTPGPDGLPLRAAPEDLVVPTLIIYGARDTVYRPEQVTDFFSRLSTSDKALVIVPDAGHFLIIQKPRLRLFTAAAQWFSYE
jgi:pimeloyl-ACP methyl ester carboxylesterase